MLKLSLVIIEEQFSLFGTPSHWPMIPKSWTRPARNNIYKTGQFARFELSCTQIDKHSQEEIVRVIKKLVVAWCTVIIKLKFKKTILKLKRSKIRTFVYA